MTDEAPENVDTRLLDARIRKLLDERGNGSGPGGGDGLSARVERLEARFLEVDKKLDRIENQMAKAVDVAEIKGRVSQLPTIWQLAGLILAILGATFAMLRFGLPRVP